MSAEAKAKMAATKRGVWHRLTCSCGCGSQFELPDFRVRANKTGLFFLNMDHKVSVWHGEIHPNFRGGPVKYGRDWDRIAESIRTRDGVCQLCGKTAQENGRALDVHHRIPYRVSQDNRPENLVTLCATCHQQEGIAAFITYPATVDRRVRCLFCQKLFLPVPPGRKTCSAACRKARHRETDSKTQHRRERYQPGTEAYVRQRAYIKEWQRKNKERVNAWHRAAYDRRHDEIRAYQRAYYASHKKPSRASAQRSAGQLRLPLA